jgi:DMSO/TMAO reductase YedYZ molybdopterin-dependent catalytic subunit
VPTATPPVTTATPEVLRNENREGAYVRYYNPFPPVDPEAWTLSVGGKVRHPQRLSLKDVLAIPKVAQSSRMKCVEGWSFPAKWEGFRPQELVDRVKPYEDATWVHFYCADDYYESLPLGDLLLDRVLFAYGMNDARLEPAYGAPLRLIVPFKYGYKGPKAITRIEFATEELRGYWSTVGPYSTEGDVQPGWDHALDLDDFRQVEGWGEIVYEDGIEAQEE